MEKHIHYLNTLPLLHYINLLFHYVLLALSPTYSPYNIIFFMIFLLPYLSHLSANDIIYYIDIHIDYLLISDLILLVDILFMTPLNPPYMQNLSMSSQILYFYTMMDFHISSISLDPNFPHPPVNYYTIHPLPVSYLHMVLMYLYIYYSFHILPYLFL